ncbi:phage antirepressor Ant [Histophilus somni]|uniref:Phage antirepressor Ant n=1 Tax=Histophilus somni TaxID=731 RepID=A0AAX2S1C4_HISSO|nr:antA/AntB antirepressor family protein [Histophilus somni]TEW31414.1 phage antirepressor Ant [Histophilus somni]THA97462.1 phage antirepressor Ant [Histophilus somni]
MTTFQISTFTGSIQNQPIQLINARELHEVLQISTRFDTWIQRRIFEYNFAPNLDFIERSILGNRGFFKAETKEYHITLDMAKELCMLERSELGQQARRYFIQKEKEANALKQALPQTTVEISTDKYIELLETQNQLLKQAMKPQQYKLRLSTEEKSHILRLHQQGLSTSQIVQQSGRSESAVRTVIRENTAE